MKEYSINLDDLFSGDPKRLEDYAKAIGKLEGVLDQFIKVLGDQAKAQQRVSEEQMKAAKNLEGYSKENAQTLEKLLNVYIKFDKQQQQNTQQQQKAQQAQETLNKLYNQQTVQLSEVNQALKETKKTYEQTGDQKQLKNFQKLSDEFEKQKKVINEVRKESRDKAKADDVAQGSIVDLRRELSKARKQYDNLTRAQRKNEQVGGQLVQTINQLDKELKDLEGATGRNQRNVGNYTESIKEAMEGMEGLGGSIGGTVGSFAQARQAAITFFNALLANPVGLVIAAVAALVAIVASLVNGFVSTKKGANTVKVGFATIKDALKPLIDLYEQGVKAVGNFITAAVESMTELVGANESAADSYTKIEEALNKLEKRERAFEAINKAQLAEAERLKNIRDDETKSIQDRIKANEDLAQVEQARLKDSFDIRRDRLAITLRELKNQKEAVLTADQQRKVQAEIKRLQSTSAEEFDRSVEKHHEMIDLLEEIGADSEEIQRFEEARFEVADLIEDSLGRQNEQIINQVQLRKELLEFENEAAVAVAETRAMKAREGSREEMKARLEVISLQKQAEIAQVEFSGRTEEQKQALITKILTEATVERAKIVQEYETEAFKTARDIKKRKSQFLKSNIEDQEKALMNSLDEETKARIKALKKQLKDYQTQQEAQTEIAEKEAEKRKEIEEAAIMAVTEGLNLFFDFQRQSRQAEIERLEAQKQQEIEMAGDNADARESIERRYDQKISQLKRKQARQDKLQAMFNIAINTAEAVAAAYPNFPLAMVIGALGAAQWALVAAKPIPQFRKGTKVAPPGWKMVNEEGPEIIRKGDKSFVFTGRNVVFDSPGGEEIKTVEESRPILEGLSRSKEIQMELANNQQQVERADIEMTRFMATAGKGISPQQLQKTVYEALEKRPIEIYLPYWNGEYFMDMSYTNGKKRESLNKARDF